MIVSKYVNTLSMLIVKSVAILLCFSLPIIGIAQARKPSPEKKSPESTNNKKNSLLWEITGKGLTAPSYLYGTMHIVCSEDARISKGLKNAIQKSKQVFFEIDMDNMEEMMGILTHARMNNGLKISDLVTPVEYSRLEDYFSRNKSPLPFSMMSRFKPYFITAIISESMMDCKTKSSVEQLIMTEARNNDKEVLGLETIEFQASIFDKIPYEKQAQDLVKYVDSIDHYKENTLELIDLYRKQDVDSMEQLMVKYDPGMADFMDVLLYDRNRRWMGQMEEQMFQMPTLFAVGAGHLGGEKGVIALLRKQGFTVKALDNTELAAENGKEL
jgi:uncharacterized protein YbaP (TraB family)